MRADDLTLSCPLPAGESPTVQLAHGGGGRRTRALIERVFLDAFRNPELHRRHDSAVLPVAGGRVAFTTDSYVVSPLFFPGGDIGKLAVLGTVNDLAMTGATPRWLSAGFILEEGLDMQVLRRVVESMRDAAATAAVELVTGDTKVVDHGKGDGIFINTSGVGLVPPGVEVGPARVRPGDAVLLSGDVGRHGVAILSVREGLEFEAAIESDCASLVPLVSRLVEAGIALHCMRDLTRGGLASALNEIAQDAGVGIDIEESHIPVSEPVRGACELLGLDPLYVANEGRMVVFVPQAHARRALAALHDHQDGRDARRIGRVTETQPGGVIVRGALGTARVLDLLSGEQLPRIC